jgi:hypothetical protein
MRSQKISSKRPGISKFWAFCTPASVMPVCQASVAVPPTLLWSDNSLLVLTEPACYWWELVFLSRHFAFSVILSVFRGDHRAQSVFPPVLGHPIVPRPRSHLLLPSHRQS